MIILRSPALRFLGGAALLLLLFWIPGPLAAAPAKPKPQAATAPANKAAAAAPAATSAKPGTGQALKLGQFDDWIAYATPGAKKICYALSVPKERLPKNLNRDPGYLFVSYRPDEKVRGEIAVVMGFAVKENSPAEALLGSNKFELAGKDTSLFVHNAAEEGTMLAAMKRGGSLVVKASSKRGNETTDRFSLAGIVQALDRAEKECK
ncbi:MAG: hypothetical protein JO094_09500 [Hyphomicrobiales bacterium]|nr:hypothetical protein [Hyphomicrobiales bacterium]MBV8769114.1 hypothetical protein [Hyphomicrobiales bacterium]MBV9054243.1 hypothetical protein [Hyphomicrobiales bacterium]MBV9588607.1 hypothetical protein [Hyphomicrobiales bacterium]MBV9976659.1 hypothetical protein [Hyphomicrobiales bacterium]